MALIKRVCPYCSESKYDVLVNLKQEQFTKDHPSYRVDRLLEMRLKEGPVYPIVLCAECGMIYSLYHLNDELESFVYNDLIDVQFSKSKALSLTKTRANLVRWLNLLYLAKNGGNIRVLDYGCGWGSFLLVAQGPGIECVGFDVTPWKVSWARDQGLTVVDSEDLLYQYAPFDICVSTAVLEHLRYPVSALKTMTALLRPGGYAYITGIVRETKRLSKWAKIKRRVENGSPICKNINPWEHLNYFTQDTFVELLGSCGLVPIPSPGYYLDGNDIVKQTAKIILKKCLSSICLKNWISGYWQLKKK